MNTIYIHSFSKYGSREVSQEVFNRLLAEKKIHEIKSKFGGTTHWFFKPLVTITKQQK